MRSLINRLHDRWRAWRAACVRELILRGEDEAMRDLAASLRAQAEAARSESMAYPPASPQRNARVCRSSRLAAEALGLERAVEGRIADAADAQATAEYWRGYELQYMAAGEMAGA